MLSCKLTTCSLTDLQSCYNRKPPSIGGIIEESAERDRNAMKLITKVMPNLRHYLCTGFGISSEYCGRECNQLAGTGQGNQFSGNLCQDTSYLMAHDIERKQLGIKITSNLAGKVVWKVVVS